jgi:hypothetical protein
MHAMFRKIAVFAVAGVMMAGATGLVLAQNHAPGHPPVPGVAPPYYTGPGWGPEEEPAPENAQSADLPVLYVTSVEILHASADPEMEIVRVTGLAASDGWSVPELVPTYAGKPFDAILDLELVAIPPQQSQHADGFVPVSAILPLEHGAPFKGVRVRGSENAVTVKQIPGANQVAIDTNDCRSCEGKKFVAAGTQVSQQDSVREQDLPKLLRVLHASDGIRGAEPNPNRLTLILDEDGTIVEAFWE